LTLAGAWIAQGLELPGDADDPVWAHLLIEAARQAGQDRPEALYEGADPCALLDLDMLARRREAISSQRAATVPDAYGEGGTIYLCAVDRDRLGVSLTQSNFKGWGSGVIVPRSRIFLHNRGAAFSLEPGHPAEYRSGRRPPHTLSPAAVTRSDGSLHSVIGTMGGDSQPQVLLQLLAHVLRAGQFPAEALAAPRWVLSAPSNSVGSSADLRTGPWGGGTVDVQVEGHAPPGWDDALRRRGHKVLRIEPFSHRAGHAHLITVTDDYLSGAADPRTLGGEAATW
jgi:gamma-glutamyltranspeptidase / glutathione hydrolase